MQHVVPPLPQHHLPEPRAPPDLGTQRGPVRIAETIRYAIASAEYAIAPDGLLRWLAVVGMRLGAILGLGWLIALVLLQVVILLVQVAVCAVVIALCVLALRGMAGRR